MNPVKCTIANVTSQSDNISKIIFYNIVQKPYLQAPSALAWTCDFG